MTAQRASPTGSAPPLAVRLAFMLVSLLVTACLCEGMVRFQSQGALPYPNLFEQRSDGGIGLLSRRSVLLRRADGETYELHTGAHGLRVSSMDEAVPKGGWLVVGDSQVLGQGVDQEDTFSGRLTAEGTAVHNAGVPGFGVEDSLARAAELLPAIEPMGVVVVINQLNDWEDEGRAVGDRYRVRGGWLVRAADADGPRARFLASFLARSHLAFYAGWSLLGGLEAAGDAHAQLAPAWVTDPSGQESRSARIAKAVSSFGKTHASVRVVVSFLPADFATGAERAQASPFAHYSEAGPRLSYEDTTLRDQIVVNLPWVPVVDLLPVLRDRPEAFLNHDYHLSELGHGLLAEALKDHLEAER